MSVIAAFVMETEPTITWFPSVTNVELIASTPKSEQDVSERSGYVLTRKVTGVLPIWKNAPFD